MEWGSKKPVERQLARLFQARGGVGVGVVTTAASSLLHASGAIDSSPLSLFVHDRAVLYSSIQDEVISISYPHRSLSLPMLTKTGWAKHLRNREKEIHIAGPRRRTSSPRATWRRLRGTPLEIICLPFGLRAMERSGWSGGI